MRGKSSRTAPAFALALAICGVQGTVAAHRIQADCPADHVVFQPQDARRAQLDEIVEEAHRLVTLPYCGVFDWLEGQVTPDGILVLRGQVVRPATKTDAEARVRSVLVVFGVTKELVVASPGSQARYCKRNEGAIRERQECSSSRSACCPGFYY
jgi:Fe-S cluster assembly scaffold protein SufB